MKSSIIARCVMLGLLAVSDPRLASAGALDRPVAVGTRDIDLGCDPDDPLLPGNLASSIQLKDPLAVVGAELMVPRFTYTTPSGDRIHSKNLAHALPYLTYARPISDWMAFKVNVSTPFGLGSSFEKNPQQLGYDTSTLISLTTIVPSLSFRLTDTLALGVGVSIGWAQFKYIAPFDVNRVPLPVGTSSKAMGFGIGGGAGLLFHLDDKFAVGVNYMSPTYVLLEGRTDITIGPWEIRDHFDSAITFPDKLDVGIAWKPTESERWLLCADYNWYGYSKTPNAMKLVFRTLPLTKANDLSWQDNFSAHFGTSYRVTKSLTVRGGFGYMSQSIPDKTVSTLTLDTPGWALALGCTHRIGEHVSLDASVTRGWGTNRVEDGLMQGTYSADIYTFALAGNILF